MQGFDVDCAVVLDVELKLAAPFDECGFGDLKFFGDTRKAPAFSAEANETLLCFDVIHSTARIHPVFEALSSGGQKVVQGCDSLRRFAKTGDKRRQDFYEKLLDAI